MAGVEYVISLRDKFSPVMARARSGFEKIDRSVRTLNNSISGTSLALAGMAIGFGAIKGLKLAGEFEQTQVAFETMLGSAEKGQEVLGKLAEFATKTPFSIKGVEDNAKLLLAVGVEVDNLLPTCGSCNINIGTKTIAEYSQAIKKPRLLFLSEKMKRVFDVCIIEGKIPRKINNIEPTKRLERYFIS